MERYELFMKIRTELTKQKNKQYLNTINPIPVVDTFTVYL